MGVNVCKNSVSLMVLSASPPHTACSLFHLGNCVSERAPEPALQREANGMGACHQAWMEAGMGAAHHPQELVDVIARVTNDAPKHHKHIVHIQAAVNLPGLNNTEGTGQ